MNGAEYIESVLIDEAKLIKEYIINNVVIEVWQEVNAMPPQKVALLLDMERNVILAITNDSDVKTVVKRLELKREDIEVFFEMFEYIALHNRTVINKIEYSYQEKINDIWHEPKMVDGDLIFFVDNEAEGILEKFVIKNLRDTEIVSCAKTIGIALR